ncbi:DUF4232 domain-containing protein [Streptomyces sp. NBC_01525]|uniref:DUF4232 domain-containing protein n=1 Tax=Streptomyces sp. NBC_01525 TaxID=2903893 RepID=UPI00386571F2
MRSNTVRTARRRTLRVAAAALTMAAGLTLTACSGADAGGAKAAGQADAAAAATDVDAGAGASTTVQNGEPQAGSGAKGGAKGDAKTDAKAGASGGQAANSSAAQGERCHTSGLKASFATGGDAAPDPDAEGATTTSIALTNTSGRTCKIGGFPGVDLTSENGGGTWSLVRSSAKYSSITLGPGDTTDFTINLGLAHEGDDGTWMPAYAEITPPNETTSLKVEWPWGPLIDQSAATHPVTFVNPIG